MALNLYMSLELSNCFGTVSGNSNEFKAQFNNFLKQLHPVNGFITIRSFKNYVVTNFDVSILPQIALGIKTLKNWMNEDDLFTDIFELTLQKAEM